MEILNAGNGLIKRIRKIIRDREKNLGTTPEKVILSPRLFFLMAEYSDICNEFLNEPERVSLEELLEEDEYELDTGLGSIGVDMNISFPPHRIEVKWRD